MVESTGIISLSLSSYYGSSGNNKCIGSCCLLIVWKELKLEDLKENKNRKNCGLGIGNTVEKLEIELRNGSDMNVAQR